MTKDHSDIEPAGRRQPADDEPAGSSAWADIAGALTLAGRAVGAGTAAVGRSVASAYRAVDPDLRRQALQAPLVGLMALAPRARRPQHARTDRRNPIIFVHGLGGHPTNFAAMQRYVAFAGGPATHSFDLRAATSLPEMADDLAELIAELSAATPSDKVDVVTHSMGGIIARLALDDVTIRRRVGTLVTLATPHRGTYLARLAATPRTLDLRPHSDICARLDRQDFWSDADAPRLVALWSRSDATILPPESAAWSAATCYHMDDFTHLSYLLSPASWRRVFELLDAPADH